MSETKSTLGVAIVGCGTVGGASAQILTRDKDALAARVGVEIELRAIVDVKFDHAKAIGLPETLYTEDLDAVLTDPDVHVVVELVGGTTFARELIHKAVTAGKHIVTANKALLAHHGEELYALARKHGVCLAFEASCAGGIPIIKAITESMAGNRIDALYGIVNGTCNYILTEMLQNGRDYETVLGQAQQDGLAEADPTLDVGGGDSAHKLAILASLAFQRKIDFDAIPVQGIDELELCDVAYGEELGYTIKLLAIAQRQDDGVALRVRPVFISHEHPLAWVAGPFNAVSVYGSTVGHTMYYGRGAGGSPTGSAIVADIVSVALGNAQQAFSTLGVWPDRNEPANQLPAEAIESRYYIRIVCEDKPGVLGHVAMLLGEHEISISSVLQHEPREDLDAAVPVVITTSRAVEGNLRAAIEKVAALSEIKAAPVVIGIVEEHEEVI